MPFTTQIQELQFLDKYSRFDWEKLRRETWEETVNRAVSFLIELSENKLSEKDYNQIKNYILELKAMPSMRLMAMAGPAARRNNACIYNCAYLQIDSLTSFKELFLLCMSGCGVGYSVEKNHIKKLPKVKPQTGLVRSTYVIPDNTEGWVDSFYLALQTWFNGEDIVFDYSQIRATGTPLKTKGGTAAGSEKLQELMEFTKRRILARQGKQLRSIDVHDILCKIGWCVVSGGVRRSALICLFDLDDEEVLKCKDNGNIIGNEQRWKANNSVVLKEKVDKKTISNLMWSMHDGKNGEPGIFSRYAANITKPIRRKSWSFGSNPCGEIALRSDENGGQFCNLSVAVAREKDTLNSLKEKVRIATIIGTIQSMATYFPGLRDGWEKNCVEERLLGVDIIGQMDSSVARNPHNQDYLKNYAVSINKEYSEKLGINPSTSVTCVKPSGNTSVLLDAAPGMHPRHSKYYIRRLRIAHKSPMYELLSYYGFPMVPEVGSTLKNVHTWVISFPIKSPDKAITRKDLSALEQLNYWKQVKVNWTEHNPSQTISYREEELESIIDWLYDHQEIIGGLSFLPIDDFIYDLAPLEEITENEYLQLKNSLPNIDFRDMGHFDRQTDNTTVSSELACFAGQCLI